MRGMRDVRNRKLTTNTFVSEEMVTLDISCNPSSSYDAGSSDEGFQYETPTIHNYISVHGLREKVSLLGKFMDFFTFAVTVLGENDCLLLSILFLDRA